MDGPAGASTHEEVGPAAGAHPGSLPHPTGTVHYLFKCSSRKRKVMRLGSGRERSRCIMQFSLAAGSDRAVGRGRARAGLGSQARRP